MGRSGRFLDLHAAMALHVPSPNILSFRGHLGGQREGRRGVGSRRCRMGVMDRIRRLTRDQQDTLRAIDREEQNAIELENLEADHLAAEEAYLRRKDRLLGHEVQEVYPEIVAARGLLAQSVRRRQERFEALRVAVLTG